MKTLDLQIGGNGQCVFYLETLEVGNAKLWIKIQPDSVAIQSKARVFHWSGGEWKLIHNIEPELMATSKTLGYRGTGLTKADFKKDRDRLLKMATTVLGVE
jgi:hypothetical protein